MIRYTIERWIIFDGEVEELPADVPAEDEEEINLADWVLQ